MFGGTLAEAVHLSSHVLGVLGWGAVLASPGIQVTLTQVGHHQENTNCGLASAFLTFDMCAARARPDVCSVKAKFACNVYFSLSRH